MQKMTFTLNISYELFEHYYKGSARSVVVTTDDGRTLKFPANSIQKFLLRDGIHGHFEIIFDRQNKIAGLNRIG